jgi:hypothetical protein
MTRKERVELKTLHFCEQICDAMKGPGTVRDAAERGDRFLNQQIRSRPQEKSFILNCGHRVAKKWNALLEEKIERMESKLQELKNS